MDAAPREDSLDSAVGPCVYCGAPAGARGLRVGDDPCPAALNRALALVRAAAARANSDIGHIEPDVGEAIALAALQISEQRALGFARSVWQDGGGAALAYPLDAAILKAARRRVAVPAADIRRHQCADAVQTAVQVAALAVCEQALAPALDELAAELEQKTQAWAGLIKIGRTHLQDAAPLTLGQEVSGYLQQVRNSRERVLAAAEGLRSIPLGRGCLGVGAGVPVGFAERAVQRLTDLTALPLRRSQDALADLSGPGALAFYHAALAALAAALFKIASDISLLTSGPNAGFNELRLAETGLLCSALPGKTNPDPAEALAQVCVQVMGSDAAVVFATSQGQFEANAYLPLLAFNLLRSTVLIGDAVRVFARQGVAGLEPRRDVLAQNVAKSVMLVTALAPHIGYDAAASIAKDAYRRNISLRQAAMESGLVDAAAYDRLVRPERMLGPDGA